MAKNMTSRDRTTQVTANTAFARTKPASTAGIKKRSNQSVTTARPFMGGGVGKKARGK